MHQIGTGTAKFYHSSHQDPNQDPNHGYDTVSYKFVDFHVGKKS
jgi:hypothetical protein